MKIRIDLTPKVRGKVTLGPVPGTPEYEQEQRERRANLEAKTATKEPREG